MFKGDLHIKEISIEEFCTRSQSKISVQVLSIKISEQDLRSLHQVSVQDLYRRSPGKISAQDLYASSVGKISVRDLLARSQQIST